jgi:DNA-binding response OmpR family regulator
VEAVAMRIVRPARILVIEDHAGAARGLRALLCSRGHQVEVAPDAAAALARAGEEELDLVVADCDLGEQDGTEVVRAIRARRPALPILVVTARDRSRVLERLEGLDPRDCFQKPVQPDALLAAVERKTDAVPR